MSVMDDDIDVLSLVCGKLAADMPTNLRSERPIQNKIEQFAY
jgi:hypothetical protein